MGKKVNEINNGDLKSNIVVLRSCFGKAGLKYFIQPQKDSRGLYAPCVRRIDSKGDMILSDKDRNSSQYFIPENQTIVVQDGTTFNLDNEREAAEWEAIKNCKLIAPDRFAKDKNGNYLIDGNDDIRKPRYGIAELYIEHPGQEAKIRVTKAKKENEAKNYIFNDSLDHLIACAKVLGRTMTNSPAEDIQYFLLSVASQNPDKIIQCYTDGNMGNRILFIDATARHVINKRNGLYVYGDEDQTILGATDQAAIDWLNAAKNSKLRELIRNETYPELISTEL